MLYCWILLVFSPQFEELHVLLLTFNDATIVLPENSLLSFGHLASALDQTKTILSSHPHNDNYSATCPQ